MNRRKRSFLLMTLSFFMASETAIAASKIAVILPETGRLSTVALEMQRAVMISEAMAESGDESQVEFEFHDNYGHPDSARALAERLAVREDILAFAGGLPSECALQLTEIAFERRIPYLIFAASSDSLTQSENQYVFRIAPPTSLYNDGLLGWAGSIAGSNRPLAMVFENHPRSFEAVADLKEDLNQLWQGEILHHEFESGEDDFTPAIKLLSERKPALVWIIGSVTDAARFLKQCRENDYLPNAFALGTTNLVNNRIISLAEGAADYCFAPAVWWPLPNWTDAEVFINQFTDLMGRPPGYHAAEAFSGAQTLRDAVARCQEPHRESLRLALDETNLPTVIGRVKFDNFNGFTNQNRQRTLAAQLRKDRWYVVWPRETAERNYVYPTPTWKERARSNRQGNKLLQNIALIPLLALIIVMMRSGAKKRRELLRKLNEDK